MSCLLLVSFLLCGFGLPVPEEWSNRDSSFDISSPLPNQDPRFTIPWWKDEYTPVIIPIPNTYSADDNISIVPIEPNESASETYSRNGMAIISVPW